MTTEPPEQPATPDSGPDPTGARLAEAVERAAELARTQRRLAAQVADVAEHAADVHDHAAQVHERLGDGRLLDPEQLRDHAREARDLAARERAAAADPEPGDR